jgi:pyruvate dehydrogenase E2 component (dihydrolipoamide acetyltransferase)
MFRFQLPDIGEGIVEAEVIEWKVAEGDQVSLDQILVEVMTDKANIEIPSPRAGRVHRLAFAEGDIVPVGAVLIEIDDEETAGDAAAAPVADGAPAGGEARREAPPPPPAVSPPPPKPPAPASRVLPPPPRPAPVASDATAHPPAMPPRPRSSQLATASGGEEGVRAVPAVRDLARRLGIDLTQCVGTGPGGRIMRRDVEELAAEQAQRVEAAPAPVAFPLSAAVSAVSPAPAAPDPEDWERVPMRGVRRAIASHMARSRRTAAHFSYVEEVDLTRLLEERDRVPELRDLSPLVFIARAAVEVLPEHPLLNASLDEERGDLIFKRLIHLGIAVAAEEGLLVPVIENAASLSMLELAREIEALAEGAREGRLGPSQLHGSTFTITSLGKLGGVASTPILNYPESAILGVNALRRLPRYVDGELMPRDVLNLSMSVDHRIADGLHCARFTQDVKRRLEQASFPEFDGS